MSIAKNMRIPFIVALALPLLGGCAGRNASAGGSAQQLHDEQQIELENIRKALRSELEGIREELAAIKAEQQELKEAQEALASKVKKPDPPKPRRYGPDPEAVYAIPLWDSPAKGPQDAWVTIVEISDFQCPYCKRVTPTLDGLLKQYGKDLRLVFKHNPLPFHKRAMPAAVASECARVQGKFWEMHDLLFENNRSLEDEDIEKYARQASLNLKKFKTCYSQGDMKERAERDQKMATKFGARGTPAFFINGRFLSGAQPSASFERLIDEELKKAKKSGIVRSKYYSEAVLEKGEKTYDK